MKKLTKAQKKKNKAAYKAVKKEFNKVRTRNNNVTYVQFKRRVKARMEAENLNWKSAAKKEAHTETFVSAGERSRENLIKAIKDDFNDVYRDLRNKSRDKGKFVAIKDNLTWDSDRNGYILNAGTKQYFIDVSNSPKDISILEIN